MKELDSCGSEDRGAEFRSQLQQCAKQYAVAMFHAAADPTAQKPTAVSPTTGLTLSLQRVSLFTVRALCRNVTLDTQQLVVLLQIFGPRR